MTDPRSDDAGPTVTATDEAPRSDGRPGFSDSLTFSFADPVTELYGIARLGRSVDPDGTVRASGLALLFAGREPIAARAAGGLEVTTDTWEAIDAAGVSTSTDEPLRGWRVAFASEDATAGFDLAFTAASEPAMTAADDAAAVAGGMVGYEQLCRVGGTVRAHGGERRIECVGQRGHAWGAPDWDKLALVRTVGAWGGDDLGYSLASVRTKKAKHHSDEALSAVLFAASDDAPEGALAAARPVVEGRLSTTYDADGRQRRASIELFEHDDSWARRAAGEAICGTTLDLGRLRLDCAFFRWQINGREGVGRYDVLSRSA